MTLIITTQCATFGRGYFLGFDKEGYAHFQSCRDHRVKTYKTRRGAEKQLQRILQSGEMTDDGTTYAIECAAYEPDPDVLREAEDMEASYRACIGEERWAQEQRDTEQYLADNPEPPSPMDTCGACCKHMTSGKGYPGEHITYCHKLGKVLDYSVNLAEVI